VSRRLEHLKPYVGVLASLFGLLALELLGKILGWLLDRHAPMRIAAPEDLDKEEWRKLLADPEGHAGRRWIGRLERWFVFFSVLLAQKEAGVAIAAWLAFKLASKWETWSNIIKLPDKFGETYHLDYLRARREWGDRLYQRFLIGTLGNVLAGALIAWLVLVIHYAGNTPTNQPATRQDRVVVDPRNTP
jgi:hypothetical protein